MNLVAAEQASLSRARAARPHAAENPPLALTGRMIFVALLGLVALAAVPYGSAELWWEALFACAIFALYAVRTIEGFFEGSLLPVGLSLLAPLGILVAFGLVQSLGLPHMFTAGSPAVGEAISRDPYATWLFSLKLLALVLAGELLLRYTVSLRRMELLAYTVIGVGVASGLFGILRQLAQPEDSGFVLSSLWPNVGYGQFINRNHFAYLMEMTLGLLLGLISGKGVRREALPFYLAASAIVGIALVLTNSRGGVLSLICQLLFLATLIGAAPRARNSSDHWLWRVFLPVLTRIVLIAGIVAIVVMGIVWIGGSPLVDRFEELQDDSEKIDDRSNTRRSDIWQMTWEMFKAHPVAGVGFGGYWIAVPQHHDASGEFTPQEAHNDFLEIAASGGLIGVTLVAWFCLACLKKVRRQLRSENLFRRAICLGSLAGLFAVAVHSCLDFGLHVFINALIFTALVVLAVADVPTQVQMPGNLKNLLIARRQA